MKFLFLEKKVVEYLGNNKYNNNILFLLLLFQILLVHTHTYSM